MDLRIVTADTDLTPVDLGSYSSRVTLMTGNAAMEAADRARTILARGVGEKLEIPGDRLVFAGGRVFDAEDPDRGVSFDQPADQPVTRLNVVLNWFEELKERVPGGR